ncbi:MAG: S8 family serine peptidase [Pseudonocardiales bacterium]
MRVVRRASGVALVAAVLCLAAGGPAQATPPIPDLSKQYWFGNYRISEIWATGATGQGMIVAVLDTGVQASTAELKGVVLPGTDLAGGDGRTDTDRFDGHGTSMARRIAGQGGGKYDLTGIAPSAKILPVVVHNEIHRSADTARAESQGIRYAVDHDARIINLSQGTDGTGEPNQCPTEVAAAVRYAIGKGAVIVASAGNEARKGNPPFYPATCAGVLSVGAVDGSKRPWPDSERQTYVDVAAPGVNMVDVNFAGQLGFSEGTSDSAALVSGAVALVWSKFPKLTNRQVVARLLATVTEDASTPGKDLATGYGIVRPLQAITTDVPANAPNPVFDEVAATAQSSPTPSTNTSQPATGETGPVGPTTAPKSNSGSNTLPIVLGAGGVLLLIVIVALVLRSQSRRRTGPGTMVPPPGPLPPYR